MKNTSSRYPKEYEAYARKLADTGQTRADIL